MKRHLSRTELGHLSLWQGFGTLLLIIGVGFVGAQPFSMARVASIPGVGSAQFLCGDLNHNSRTELYCTSGLSGDTLIIIEFSGDNWERINTTTCVGSVDWTAEDYDGLGEVLCMGFSRIKILKSPDYFSFPRDSVWGTHINGNGPFYSEIVNLDTFPDQELAVRLGQTGVLIYKNRGGCRYDSITILPVQPSHELNQYAIGDFDLDGLPEIAYGDDWVANIYVFAWTGIVGQYNLVAVCSTETIENQKFASSARMDRDGRPEFATIGIYDSLTRMKIMVYDADGHGQYKRIWEHDLPFDGLWAGDVIAADLDGDGMDEIVTSSAGQALVFKNTGLHAWDQVAMMDSVGGWYIGAYDINHDGRVEVMYDIGMESTEHIVAYEDTVGLVNGVEIASDPPAAHPSITPCVARQGAVARIRGIPEGSELRIFNAAGTQIRGMQFGRQPAWTWDLTDQHGRCVPAGTYFVLIRFQGQTARTKLCVVN